MRRDGSTAFKSRSWLSLALVVTAVPGALLAAVAWRCSDLILLPDRPPTLHEQRVLAAAPGRIRLSRDSESLQPGTWALQWREGFGRVGDVLATDDTSVVRDFRPLVGRAPVGGWASLRGVSRSADPLSMLGISYETVAVPGPLGGCPAWFLPGPDSTWVLYVHGRGTTQSEGLRTLSVLAARGLPALMVTYRNDVNAPPSPDGLSHLGLTEWTDLEAAAGWALAHGARDLVLSGYSLGGQIVMQFMARSKLAPHVRAIVLEAPVLDWNATLARRARVLRVPLPALWLGKAAARARAGIDWRALDQCAGAAPLTVPLLLFHGVHDTFAPLAVSEHFQREHPSAVTLVRIPRGNHVEAWNVDPVRYRMTLGRWCEAHRIGRAEP